MPTRCSTRSPSEEWDVDPTAARQRLSGDARPREPGVSRGPSDSHPILFTNEQSRTCASASTSRRRRSPTRQATRRTTTLSSYSSRGGRRCAPRPVGRGGSGRTGRQCNARKATRQVPASPMSVAVASRPRSPDHCRARRRDERSSWCPTAIRSGRTARSAASSTATQDSWFFPQDRVTRARCGTRRGAPATGAKPGYKTHEYRMPPRGFGPGSGMGRFRHVALGSLRATDRRVRGHQRAQRTAVAATQHRRVATTSNARLGHRGHARSSPRPRSPR